MGDSCGGSLGITAEAVGAGSGWKSAGCSMSFGIVLFAAIMTLSPIRVTWNSFGAKEKGSRIQPWEAGWPGTTPPWSAVPDHVTRCIQGIGAALYMLEW